MQERRVHWPAHEVADAKTEQVHVERQGFVEVGDHQDGVAQALCAGAKARDVAGGLERRVRQHGAVKRV